MTIGEIAKLLDANVLTPELNMDRNVHHAFASDLMSDVLTRDYQETVLVTGLSNLQAIRTAEMSEISEVIIGRDKQVSPEMITLAAEHDIVLLKSPFSLFRISGVLYQAGVKPIF